MKGMSELEGAEVTVGVMVSNLNRERRRVRASLGTAPGT